MLFRSVEEVSRILADFGARSWQIEHVAPLLASALCKTEPIEILESETEKTAENQAVSE